MIKLGHKNKKSTSRVESNIDSKFFELKFKVNGRVFEVAVEELLAFEQENLDEVSDEAFDKALDICSYWRFTFLSAAVELEKALAAKKREEMQWLAGVNNNIRKLIIESRTQTKKQTGVPNNWFGSITKQDIEYEILSNEEYSSYYLELTKTIDDLTAQVKLLYGLRDILEQRGNHLQSLGRRRLENNKRNFNT